MSGCEGEWGFVCMCVSGEGDGCKWGRVYKGVDVVVCKLGKGVQGSGCGCVEVGEGVQGYVSVI